MTIRIPLLATAFAIATPFAATSAAQDITFEEVWRVETNQPHFTRPAIDGEVLYIGGEDGVLRALDKQTGEARWVYEAGAGIGSGTGFDDMRVYVTSRDGHRSKLFDAEGKLITGTIQTFEYMFALYDRFLRDLGGIPGGLAVEGDMLYYATGAGSVVAVRASGVTLAEGVD